MPCSHLIKSLSIPASHTELYFSCDENLKPQIFLGGKQYVDAQTFLEEVALGASEELIILAEVVNFLTDGLTYTILFSPEGHSTVFDLSVIQAPRLLHHALIYYALNPMGIPYMITVPIVRHDKQITLDEGGKVLYDLIPYLVH